MLFWALFLLLIAVIHSLINYHNLTGSILSNKGYLLFALIMLAAQSGNFYDDTITRKKEDEQLRKKGLTRADIENIKFIKNWLERKAGGFSKYILFNGGILLGSIIFLALSFALFPKAAPGGRQFPEFSDMISYMVKCWAIGFAVGALGCAINWNINERRFRRLTAANIIEE